ncbi:hypothetical protein K523DRAFT_278136 [Schizophyllum commune Tattone D]|nr:hypothetical protein K523DRAFT_278136 [Schizophyllum commune Tattone D]
MRLPHAGTKLRRAKTVHERIRDAQIAKDLPPYAPFKSLEEWEHLQWLITSGASQKKIDDHLKLKSVRGLDFGFKNKYSFFQYIDCLPHGPEWSYRDVSVEGTVLDSEGKAHHHVETLELWQRDPVECIRELLGNPAFNGKQGYEPIRIYSELVNNEGLNREYGEMWSAEWWWNIQKKLDKGSTVCPVILASDKTQLSRFSGDKEAWPVYLTIGNISKDVRRQPSSRASILVGYLPVAKLECIPEKERSVRGYQLFHECMTHLVETLVDAGTTGVEMTCADGWAHADRTDSTAFKTLNLRPVDPFWQNLPNCDIFSCMTPDLLHQLHSGVFSEHAAKWAKQAISIHRGDEVTTANEQTNELNSRFRVMPSHWSLRHFKKGISHTTQWTGKERKNMEKVYLGILDGATDVRVIHAMRGLLDFTYYAHFEAHTDTSLANMDAAWVALHKNKHIFEELGIRTHFNISKLHNIKHYVDAIRSRGTADGFNTEATERLHIDFAKMGYRASNHKQYLSQMTRWLARQEAIWSFDTYLQFAMPDYNKGSSAAEGAGRGEEGEGDGRHETDGGADGQGFDGEIERADANYIVAKHPSFPRSSLASIFDHYDVDELKFHLLKFLDSKGISPLSEDLGVDSWIRFPVYKQVKIKLPFVRQAASESVIDRVIASPASLRHTPRSKGEDTSTFSTILAQESKGNGENPLEGLRPARVRLIFDLPPEVGKYPHPLAFVDWYTPLNTRNEDLGMFKIKRATRHGAPVSSVIPVTRIIRSCHLSPVFGRHVDPTWTVSNVLDEALHFYVNPYLRHHDFYLLRFLYDRYVASLSRCEPHDHSVPSIAPPSITISLPPHKRARIR